MTLCEVRESGGALEVTIHGAADVANARALRDELASLVPPGRDVVVVLDDVERLDGAGVQLLVALKAFVERGDGTFVVSATTAVPAKALETAGAATALASRKP